MKILKLLSLLLFGLGMSPAVWAGKPLAAEAPFEVCTDAFTVSLTSGAWHVVPAAQCGGRTGFFLNALSTASGTVRCVPTTSAVAPTLSTATYSVWEVSPTGNASFIGANDKTYVWCNTTNATDENVSGVEVKQ